MALTQMTDDVAIIAALADLPNATSGLTAAQLKAKFDAAAVLIKTYLNSTLLAELAAVTDSDSGADNIGMTVITETGSAATVQAVIEALITRLKAVTDSASGADLIGMTAISETGANATVQSIIEALITRLKATTDSASGADLIGATQVATGSGTTTQAILEWLYTQIVNVTLGQIVDGSLTNAKLATDIKVGSLAALTTTDKSSVVAAVNEHVADNALQFSELQRIQANLVAIAEINNQSTPFSQYMYDLFKGSSENLYSSGIRDTWKSNATTALTAGATTATVLDATNFVSGGEVTIQDIVNETLRERVIATKVGNVLTFSTALVNSYSDQAQIYRSLGTEDTVAGSLDFEGASYSTTNTVTNQTVVASAYTTSASARPQKLSNGWLVSVVYSSALTKLIYYKSIDNGITWSVLTEYAGVITTGFAICCNGNVVYTTVSIITSYPYSIQALKFDATTVLTNGTGISSVVVDSISATYTFGSGVSIAIDGSGNLTAAWVSKNATFPNSFNIRSAKSTNGGVTWTKQDGTAGVDQVSNNNTAGIDITNPCLIYTSANSPVILVQNVNGANYSIIPFRYTTSWTNSTLTGNLAQLQANPSAIVKQYGSNIGRLICRWNGKDATDVTYFNERWSYSDDNGATWSAMVKITTGNTQDREKGSLSEDLTGDIYNTYEDGAGVVYAKLPNGSTTWGSPTTLNASATNPSSLERGVDFTVPLTVFMSGTSVLFSGTWTITSTLALLQEDVRYNIAPPTGLMNELRSWIQYDDFAGFIVTSALSIVDTVANESFTTMTPVTTDYGSIKESYFNGSVVTAQEKGTQRITRTRALTSDDKSLTKLLGAILGV